MLNPFSPESFGRPGAPAGLCGENLPAPARAGETESNRARRRELRIKDGLW